MLFVNFRKNSRHCYPKIPYNLRPVCFFVLTDNTSKYKEFIVICNTKTHYIRPLVVKISSQICHNYHKSKLTTTRFYCFRNSKLNNEPEKRWITYKCCRNRGHSAFFHGKQQIPRCGMKIRVLWNTAGPGNSDSNRNASGSSGISYQSCFWSLDFSSIDYLYNQHTWFSDSFTCAVSEELLPVILTTLFQVVSVIHSFIHLFSQNTNSTIWTENEY